LTLNHVGVGIAYSITWSARGRSDRPPPVSRVIAVSRERDAFALRLSVPEGEIPEIPVVGVVLDSTQPTRNGSGLGPEGDQDDDAILDHEVIHADEQSRTLDRVQREVAPECTPPAYAFAQVTAQISEQSEQRSGGPRCRRGSQLRGMFRQSTPGHSAAELERFMPSLTEHMRDQEGRDGTHGATAIPRPITARDDNHRPKEPS